MRSDYLLETSVHPLPGKQVLLFVVPTINTGSKCIIYHYVVSLSTEGCKYLSCVPGVDGKIHTRNTGNIHIFQHSTGSQC